MKNVMNILAGIAVVVILGAAAAGGYYAYDRYMPVKTRADLGSIYQTEDRNEAAIFLNYEMQEETGVYEAGVFYLPLEWVQDWLNERFYYDGKNKEILYVLPEEIVHVTGTDTGKDGGRLFLKSGDQIYLSEELCGRFTDVRFRSFGGDDYKRIYVENTLESYTVSAVKKKTALRVRGGVKSPIITDLEQGDPLVVLELLEDWAKVFSVDGHIGYMPVRRLSDLSDETPESTYTEPVYKNISLDKKIVMAWHQVTVDAANQKMEELIANTKGVNVISPTWYSLEDNSGKMQCLASGSYVEKAHAMGMSVWPAVDNFNAPSAGDLKITEILSDYDTRQAIIARLTEDAGKYGFDGINVDFEMLPESSGEHFTEFIRELSVACRKAGLVLSVDNYVPASYNSFYNRKEQGVVADYVVIMGYDEHYAGGEAGPTSSISYTRNGIEETLKSVPAEKVINGVPFYTRIWTEKGSDVTSRSLGISAAKRWVSQNGVDLNWDSDLGLYYGEKQTGEGLDLIWMEEEESMALKMDEVKSHDLAGVACWKLGFEPASIWEIVTWD